MLMADGDLGLISAIGKILEMVERGRRGGLTFLARKRFVKASRKMYA